MKASFKLYILIAGFTALISTKGFSQDSNTTAKPVDGPKELTFENGILLDQQTVQMQPKKTLEMEIAHRFSSTKNGVKDLWGVYGAANILLGLNYYLTDRIMLGFSTIKYDKLQNFQYKVKLLSETKSGSVPVSVVWYGNVVIDGREEVTFGMDYKFSSRLIYFNELMIAKKFNDHFSAQIAPSFTHYNMVDTVSDHDKIGLSLTARYKFTSSTSFVVGYDLPFYIKSITEQKDLQFKPKPNLTLGFEIATFTHTFHVFLGTANGLLPEVNMMKNANDYSKGKFKEKFIVGFNITRLWSY